MQEWQLSPRKPHLSEKCPVEGDCEGTIHCPHGDVQIHQQPLLLLAVHCGSDPLEDTAGQGWLPRGLGTTPGHFQHPLCHPFVTTLVTGTSPAQHPRQEHPAHHWWFCSSLQTPLFATVKKGPKRPMSPKSQWLGRGEKSRKSNSRLVESWDFWVPVDIC